MYWFVTRPKTTGVKVLLFNQENKVLMVRLTYYPTTWTFVGGGVHKNETPEAAATRECREEVGIVLQTTDFVTTLDFNHEYKKDTVYIFQASINTSDYTIHPKEIAEAAWFEVNDLPHMGKNAQRILQTVV